MEQEGFTTGNLNWNFLCTKRDGEGQKSQYNQSPSRQVDLRLGTFHDPAREKATEAMTLARRGVVWTGRLRWICGWLAPRSLGLVPVSHTTSNLQWRNSRKGPKVPHLQHAIMLIQQIKGPKVQSRGTELCPIDKWKDQRSKVWARNYVPSTNERTKGPKYGHGIMPHRQMKGPKGPNDGHGIMPQRQWKDQRSN